MGEWWFPGMPWWIQAGWAAVAVLWLIPAAMLVDIFWTIFVREHPTDREFRDGE